MLTVWLLCVWSDLTRCVCVCVCVCRLDGLTPNAKTPNSAGGSAKRKAEFSSPSISKIGKPEKLVSKSVNGGPVDGLQYGHGVLVVWTGLIEQNGVLLGPSESRPDARNPKQPSITTRDSHCALFRSPDTAHSKYRPEKVRVQTNGHAPIRSVGNPRRPHRRVHNPTPSAV